MQKTLKTSQSAQGVGLHTGQITTLTLHPAPIDHGIVFQRIDITSKNNLIPAQWHLVADSRLCTLLRNDAGTEVSTVEHVMSALRAANIDNALITLDGPEVPIMDGSAAPFSFLIDCAGTQTQSAARRVLKVLRPVNVVEGDKRVAFEPTNSAPSFEFEVTFAHPQIGTQKRRLSLVNGCYKSEIAQARTFGFVNSLEEIAAMRTAGLIRGGDLHNAIVFDVDKVISPHGLRFADEVVRHKILDAVGDLALAGAPIMAAYTGVKASHALNNQLLRTLFADSANYAWLEQ
jgi:UDP-3-O-[3-hydroxymyristoyl] N-acetylglucosamine deacetylase